VPSEFLVPHGNKILSSSLSEISVLFDEGGVRFSNMFDDFRLGGAVFGLLTFTIVVSSVLDSDPVVDIV
jgi:hypothetical protein